MIFFSRCILENVNLEAQSKSLSETCTQLEIAKQALEKRDGDYWKEHTVINKSQLDATKKKVSRHSCFTSSILILYKSFIKVQSF